MLDITHKSQPRVLSSPANADTSHSRKFILCMLFIIVFIAFIRSSNKELLVEQSTSNAVQAAPVNNADTLDASIAEQKLQIVRQQQKNDSLVLKKHIKNSDLDREQLLAWLKEKKFSTARHYLMTQAASAVDNHNDDRLAQIMQLLGRVAAYEGDLASTEVYLFEALGLYSNLANQGQVANTQLLIGQMYAKRRHVARSAGTAYENLLLARFFLSKNRPYVAKQMLDDAIQENIHLGRDGAVASAYQTMARFHYSTHDINAEREALSQASRYFANSGQANKANQMLVKLADKFGSLDQIEQLESEIEQKLKRYKSQISMLNQARDYMRLYNLYRNKGEAGRAWKFRVKATEILSRTSKRDMYYRTPDVMALLYDSNYNYDKAKKYYKKAKNSYQNLSKNELFNKVNQIEATLY